MSWLFGSKNKNTVPSQTNLQAHRSKQIDTLKKANLNPIEVIPNTEYRITFTCGANNITLVVTLPPQFPQDPPSVSVQPSVYHQWVDSQSKVVSCPNLMSFSMHSSLAVVIQSIIDEFRRNPPQIQSHNFGVAGPPPYPSITAAAPRYTGPGIQGYEAPTSYQASTSTPVIPSSNASQEDGYLSYTVPDVHAAFPDLKNKSLTQLNELLNEEDKILEMIQKLPTVGKIAEEREKLSNECIDLARNNLSKKPSLDQMKKWITEKVMQIKMKKKNSLYEKTQEQFEQNQRKLISQSDEFHPSIIQNNLKVALMEAEEESESIVDQFLEKKMDIDEFKQKFIHTRMVCHLRRAKDEKLNQIILRQGYSN